MSADLPSIAQLSLNPLRLTCKRPHQSAAAVVLSERVLLRLV